MRPQPLLLVVVVEAFLVEDVVVLFQGSVVVVPPSTVTAGEEVLLEVSGEEDEVHSLYPYRLRMLFVQLKYFRSILLFLSST